MLFFIEKQEARGKLTRMDTVMKFDNAREAIRRYESKDTVTFKEDEYGTSDNEDNEGIEGPSPCYISHTYSVASR